MKSLSLFLKGKIFLLIIVVISLSNVKTHKKLKTFVLANLKISNIDTKTNKNENKNPEDKQNKKPNLEENKITPNRMKIDGDEKTVIPSNNSNHTIFKEEVIKKKTYTYKKIKQIVKNNTIIIKNVSLEILPEHQKIVNNTPAPIILINNSINITVPVPLKKEIPKIEVIKTIETNISVPSVITNITISKNVSTNIDTKIEVKKDVVKIIENKKDVYYYPQIGGIKINNPLQDKVFSCKDCKNQEKNDNNSKKSEKKITFPQKPGVQFEKVNFVQDLSPGAKAAMELDQINE